MRKGEILDPSIEYETYNDYVKKKPLLLQLGDQTPDGISFAVDGDDFDHEIGYRNVIVQHGVLKSKPQAINKYLTSDKSDDFVPHRTIIKPTLFLPAREVCDLITKFRVANSISKENPIDRVKETNKWSTHNAKPIMVKFFDDASRRCKRHGWGFGTHYMRKIYCNATWELYHERIAASAKRTIGKTRVMAALLGHEGSLHTVLSYSNLEIKMDVIKVHDFTLTKSDLFLDMDAKVRHLQALIAELQSSRKTDEKEETQVGFIDPDGIIVFIDKHVQSKGIKSSEAILGKASPLKT